MKTKLNFGLALFMLFACINCARATTRTWDGGGTNNSWTTATNWVGNVAPVAGDDLVFASGAAQLSNSNNFPSGTVFKSLTFSGGNYIITGNSITNNAGITNAPTTGTTNTFNCPLTLASNQTLVCVTNTTLVLNGALNLNQKILTANSSGTLIMNGNVSSAGAGQIVKSAGGSLWLAGTNSYPNTEIQGGSVFVNGSQPLNGVLLNGGTLGGTGIVGNITSTGRGVVNPGTGSGILTASNVVWNVSTTFFVDLNGVTAGTSYDELVVKGTVNLNNAFLDGLVTFNPNIGSQSFIVIRNDGTNPVAGTFNGLPQGARKVLSSTVSGGIEVAVSYNGGDGNDVELVPVNNYAIWDGGASPDANWSNPANWVNNIAPQSSNSVWFPTGAVGLTNFNDLTNGIFIPTVRIDGSGYNILGTNRLDVFDFAANNTNGEVSFTPTLKALVNPLRLTNVVGGTLNWNCNISHIGSEVQFNPSGTMVLNTPIDGFRKGGSGTLRLPQANPISASSIPIDAGTVEVLNDQSLGGSYIIVLLNARLQLIGSRLFTNSLFLAGTLEATDNVASNLWTGPVFLGGVAATIKVASNNVLTISGQISGDGNGGTNGLTKTGFGQLVIASSTGFNVYSGPTIINEGTLFANTSLLFSPSLVVNAGAVLRGSSQIGALTNNPGGIVAPSTSTNIPATLFASLCEKDLMV